MKHDLTIERIGAKILVRSPRFPTQRAYEAIEQTDGRWAVYEWEGENSKLVFHRESREEALRSLDYITESMREFAGSVVS